MISADTYLGVTGDGRFSRLKRLSNSPVRDALFVADKIKSQYEFS